MKMPKTRSEWIERIIAWAVLFLIVFACYWTLTDKSPNPCQYAETEEIAEKCASRSRD